MTVYIRVDMRVYPCVRVYVCASVRARACVYECSYTYVTGAEILPLTRTN